MENPTFLANHTVAPVMAKRGPAEIEIVDLTIDDDDEPIVISTFPPAKKPRLSPTTSVSLPIVDGINGSKHRPEAREAHRQVYHNPTIDTTLLDGARLLSLTTAPATTVPTGIFLRPTQAIRFNTSASPISSEAKVLPPAEPVRAPPTAVKSPKSQAVAPTRQKKRKSATGLPNLALVPAAKSENEAEIINPERQARAVLKKQWKQAPLCSVESRVSGRQMNGKFQLVSKYMERKSGRRQNPLPLRSCRCAARCGSECPCLRTKSSSVAVYASRPGRPTGRVTQAFLNQFTQPTSAFIQECGDGCDCPLDCINRTVQKGRTIPLRIFETKECGFGVRTLQNIERGQFVDVYLGEIISTEELAKREMAVDEDTPSYVLSLDHFHSDNVVHVDGSNFGSVMRFVNHSCEPNCTTLPVVLPQDTKSIYHVGFFAIKDIPANTELTIDYDPSVEGIEETELDPSIVRCRCGSQKCRNRLWAPGRQRRGRRKILRTNFED